MLEADEDDAPATLLIFAFLCTPAPAAAADPALGPAASFRFFSNNIFNRLAVSVGCGTFGGDLSSSLELAVSVSAATFPVVADNAPFLPALSGGTGLADCPALSSEAGVCCRKRRNTLMRYCSSGVRESTGSSAAANFLAFARRLEAGLAVLGAFSMSTYSSASEFLRVLLPARVVMVTCAHYSIYCL